MKKKQTVSKIIIADKPKKTFRGRVRIKKSFFSKVVPLFQGLPDGVSLLNSATAD